jgi:uncharacterized protein YkwD
MGIVIYQRMIRRTPFYCSLLAIVIFALCATPLPVRAEADSNNVYLPLVTTSPPAWQPNTQELELEALFRDDPDQQRSSLSRNDTLAQVARARAVDMANRAYFGHETPEGYMANYLVESAGYLLPSYYPDNGNNVESIALNYLTAADVWAAWSKSAGHRPHIMGEETFYAEQNEYGIGYAENADGRYWVLITAKHGP